MPWLFSRCVSSARDQSEPDLDAAVLGITTHTEDHLADKFINLLLIHFEDVAQALQTESLVRLGTAAHESLESSLLESLSEKILEVAFGELRHFIELLDAKYNIECLVPVRLVKSN